LFRFILSVIMDGLWNYFFLVLFLSVDDKCLIWCNGVNGVHTIVHLCRPPPINLFSTYFCAVEL